MARSELFGDWDKTRHVMRKLATNHSQYEQVIKSMGYKIAERVWDLIESQELDMAPLEAAYHARKVAEGKDERILISSGDFLNSIKVIDITSDGDEMTVFIGVEDGITRTGIRMEELAYYIEYGTENQPARMPFQLSWEAMRGEMAREVQARIKSKVEVALR